MVKVELAVEALELLKGSWKKAEALNQNQNKPSILKLSFVRNFVTTEKKKVAYKNEFFSRSS